MLENIIFDLGAVVLEWKPARIASRFTTDARLRERLLDEVFAHQDWLDMDRGALSEREAIGRIAARLDMAEDKVNDLFALTRESLQVIPATERLIGEAHGAGLGLYCLSNMSVENYEYLRPRHDFFNRFEGIVISGYEKLIKPDPAIFALVLERFALNPASTLFIDDNADNVAAARASGIQALQFFATPDCYARVSALLSASG